MNVRIQITCSVVGNCWLVDLHGNIWLENLNKGFIIASAIFLLMESYESHRSKNIVPTIFLWFYEASETWGVIFSLIWDWIFYICQGFHRFQGLSRISQISCKIGTKSRIFCSSRKITLFYWQLEFNSYETSWPFWPSISNWMYK